MVTSIVLSIALIAPSIGGSSAGHAFKDGVRWGDVGLFVAGGSTAFLAHESGHLLTNALLMNRPRIKSLYGFGFVPFFAISPELYCERIECRRSDGTLLPGGRRGKFIIVTAGFEVQHLTSEWILTQAPDLRLRHAPWRKGWLAFNIALSCGYALASILSIEDPHGDAGGAAHLARMPRALFGAWLVLPAALDTYRYLSARPGWAAWGSRAAKGGFVGLSFVF